MERCQHPAGAAHQHQQQHYHHQYQLTAAPPAATHAHTCNCTSAPPEPPPPYTESEGASGVEGAGVHNDIHNVHRMPEELKPPPYHDEPPPAYSPPRQTPPKPDARVADAMSPKLRRERRKRKVVRACCWTGWVLCPLLCMVGQCFREDPEDMDDKIDDPCMPWYYSISPPNTEGLQ